ncbi:MAG: HNH endonuclease [Brevundimonas sp.]
MSKQQRNDSRILAITWLAKGARDYVDLIPASELFDSDIQRIHHTVAGRGGNLHGAEASVRRTRVDVVELTYLNVGINAREKWDEGTLRIEGFGGSQSLSILWKEPGGSFKSDVAVAAWIEPEVVPDLGQVASDLVEVASRGLGATTVQRLVAARLGQGDFRARLDNYWKNKCAVTGLTTRALLRASHIKAWRYCESDEERLALQNGLLLAAHIDALFDRNLIAFQEDGQIEWSDDVPLGDQHALGLADKGLTHVSPEMIPFLKFHGARLKKKDRSSSR